MLNFETGETDFENRLTGPEEQREDAAMGESLRPHSLAEYIGQTRVKENLKIFMDAAKGRGECIDHILLYGCLLYTSRCV